MPPRARRAHAAATCCDVRCCPRAQSIPEQSLATPSECAGQCPWFRPKTKGSWVLALSVYAPACVPRGEPCPVCVTAQGGRL
eukprot:2028488-Alexandrium_andersonii.AAC.1